MKIAAAIGKYAAKAAVLTGAYFAVELLVYLLLMPGEWSPLAFGGVWALLLAAMICALG